MIFVYLGTHPYSQSQDVDLFTAYAKLATLVHIDPDPSFTTSRRLAAIGDVNRAGVISIPMPTTLPGNRWRSVSEMNRWLGVRRVLRQLRSQSSNDIVLVCQRPDLLPTLRGLPANLRVYEVRDSYAMLEEDPAKARRVARCGRRMTREADLVWTTSARLAHDVEAPKAKVFESTNGVDYERFSRASKLKPPALVSAISSPRIGLVGMLNDRIDWSLIEKIALARPDWQLTFIGPVYHEGPRTKRAIATLGSLPNVHLLPGVAHSAVPAYIANLDVGLIPYCLTEATERINPYKVYQYLAAGKPVVASCLPSLSELAEVVSCCTTSDEFLLAIDMALASAKDDAAVARRQARARDFDWLRVAGRRIDAARSTLAKHSGR